MKTKMYEVFFEIIGKHLDAHKFLNANEDWLLEMYKDLSNNIPNSTIKDIKRLDLYNMGHIDYHHKFALHCDELYQKNTP